MIPPGMCGSRKLGRLGGNTGQTVQRSHVTAIAAGFHLSQVTFSIINAAHTVAVLEQIVVRFAQKIMAFVGRSCL